MDPLGRGFNFGSEEKQTAGDCIDGRAFTMHYSYWHICRGLACMRRSDYVQTRGRAGRERKGFCCGHDLSKVSQVNLVDNSQQGAEDISAALLLGLRVVIMEKKMETTTVYWDYFGIQEKKMETTMVCWESIGMMFCP